MRILALVPGGISDQLRLFPTFDDLKANYPEAEIDVIAEPRAKGAYRVSGSVYEVLPFDYKDRNGLADFGNLLGIIRDREYDAAIVIERRWSVGLLLWMSGIPLRVGYDNSQGKWFFTNTVPQKTEQYVASMYHDLLAGLGINTPCPDLAIRVPKSDLDWAEAEQARLGIAESGYIIIDGGSNHLDPTEDIDKVYPASKWQQVIEDIQQKQPDLTLVMLHGSEDTELAATLTQVCPNLRMISPPDIGKLAAMIAGANLLLCTDTLSMNLAVAVGTYTIALFGPTEANKLLPASERYIGIQSPTRWIADIQPDDVLKQVWRG